MKFKRIDLIPLSSILEKAAAVVRNKDEDHDNVIKWKLACGRNYQQIQFPISYLKGVSAQANTAVDNFIEKVKNILTQKGKWSDGILDGIEDDADFFEIFDADKKQGEMSELEKCIRELPNFEELQKEAYDIDARCQKVEEASNEEVEVEITTVPFEKIPDRISGGFLRDLSFMITGIPDMEKC